MAIGPINTSALFGIQRGFDGLRRDAAKIASASTMDATSEPRINLERTLVGLQEHSINVQASTKAFSTQERMLGVLLDELA